uniref:Disease resistance RPP13-like protein 4 n=1 Tax=Davidia involucrata TaxID=16924 RepID=A0A5B6YJJ3_DAVIN
MSTKTTSSSSEVSSSTTSHEIVPIGNPIVSSSSLNTSNQVATTQNQNPNEEIRKPTSVAHPKAKHSLRTLCCKSKDKITETNTKSKDGSTTSNGGHNEAEALSNWITADLSFIRKASETIKKYEDKIKEVSDQFEELKKDGNRDELRDLKKIVSKLKLQISSRNKDDDRQTRSNGSANISASDANKLFDKMPKLYKCTTFEQSSAFRDLEVRYDGLSSTELKLCLLCFSVFPENAIITKRLMIYWWIGEGFVRTTDKTAEKMASKFLKELMSKGFIEPFREKRSLGVDRFRMHPFTRSAVIMLAERAKFFDFDSAKGNLTEDFACSLRACLLGKGLSNIEVLEKLHMVFNVNEPILEFKAEWFLKMRNVNVLYLGRWQTSATHHIEVEDTKFLDGLMNMNHLRFFSLQGVSRITELPESISQLGNLRILDLRACHNLEVIPEGIGCLKSLTHLDMSECYLLDHMPKGLASLSELQVLNGFVVSKGKHSCTLDDLAKLPKLRKLSIYTGLKDFPTNTDLGALNQFQKLFKLTIAWGRGSLQDETNKSAKQAKDAAKSTAPGTPKQEKDAAKSTAPDTPKKAKDAAKSTLRDTGKQAQDAAKSTAPDTTKQVKYATESMASEITSPENKGSSQAPTDNDAKQENSAMNSTAADTPKRENIGDDKKKGNVAAKPVTLGSKTSFLARVLTTRPATTIKLPELPSQLEKLDLQCFPASITPSWLMPAKLKSLKKLYIRGGKFSDLGQFQELDGKEGELPTKEKWTVEVLRLKYLSELAMDWRELQELFPKLIYLEKVKCPKLTFFPCDEKGVWINKTNKSSQLQELAS